MTAVLATALGLLPGTTASAQPAPGQPTDQATPPATPPGGPFYVPPPKLPDANGALIKYEDSNVAYLGVPAKRIMYKSTDVNGNAVAVTGTVLSARAPWLGGGERPLVTFASGTIGQGDQCAPSILFQQGLQYEAAELAPLLLAGESVVVTDYLGLGTPGAHTYVNRVDEGHAVLDAARAAQQLGALGLSNVDVPAHGKVGIAGYSQGGGAAASAAELARTYAPDLDVVGSLVGAPPADLAAVLEKADGSILTGAIGYALNGFARDYPTVAAALPTVLNDKGKQLLTSTAQECVVQTAVLHGFQQSKSFTVGGQPASALLTQEPFASVVAAQRIGTMTPNAPVHLYQARNDDLVPYSQTRQLAADWCGKGATVDFAVSDLPPAFPGTAIGHTLGAVVGLPGAQYWLYQRFAGAGAGPSSCGSLPD